MTYLDLLTELQSLDDDLLLKEVTVYDTFAGEFSPAGRIHTDNNEFSPYLEI